MESSGFDDQIFNEFSTGPLSPLGAKAIQQHPHHIHHYLPSNHHHQAIMLGNDMHQTQRLPDVHNILPGGSPKMDHYKNMDYGPSHSGKMEYNVKIESSPYSPNSKNEYMNGNLTKLEQYSPSNDQYSPNGKIIEYSASPNNKLDYEHIQMFQHPQSLDSNQQNILVNNINGNSNFKRKSNENLSMSGSSTPTTATTTSASPNDASSTTSAKKPSDKKKNDPNGIKKKKTR